MQSGALPGMTTGEANKSKGGVIIPGDAQLPATRPGAPVPPQCSSLAFFAFAAFSDGFSPYTVGTGQGAEKDE
jgi:hypothetical protein